MQKLVCSLLQCRFLDLNGVVGVRDFPHQLVQLVQELSNLEQAHCHTGEPVQEKDGNNYSVANPTFQLCRCQIKPLSLL